MVGIGTNVLEIVVLAAGADTFLGIGGPARRVGAVGLTKKDRHELVHARIGEQQVRRIGQQTAGLYNGVLLRFKKIKKRLPNFLRCHGHNHSSRKTGSPNSYRRKTAGFILGKVGLCKVSIALRNRGIERYDHGGSGLMLAILLDRRAKVFAKDWLG